MRRGERDDPGMHSGVGYHLDLLEELFYQELTNDSPQASFYMAFLCCASIDIKMAILGKSDHKVEISRPGG